VGHHHRTEGLFGWPVRGFQILAVLFCFLTVWNSGIAPRNFAERLGLTIANGDGYNEIWAQHARFFVAVAAICVAALAGAESRQGSVLLLAVVFGGLIGRSTYQSRAQARLPGLWLDHSRALRHRCAGLRTGPRCSGTRFDRQAKTEAQ
jgi:hypothetical protein